MPGLGGVGLGGGVGVGVGKGVVVGVAVGICLVGRDASAAGPGRARQIKVSQGGRRNAWPGRSGTGRRSGSGSGKGSGSGSGSGSM